MSILSIRGLGMYYGAQDVFTNLTASIARGDKVALVGPNGAGKTTLLRIMIGLEQPTAGDVQKARSLRIGYLPQQPMLDSDQTLFGEMLAMFTDLIAQRRTLDRLTHELADSEEPERALERYAHAEQRFELAGGYEYEQRIVRVLGGLGFGREMHDWPISVLSGGQITRALLAKLLLEEPELLALDEPSNYLDLGALEWLESYLSNWPHSLLVISHDRYFLDHVATRVWELTHGALEAYRGDYSHFVVQRRARVERREREYKTQQAFIAKTEDFIRRYKAGQRTKEAQGRETRLKRLERVEAPKVERRINLRLATELRSGDRVLESQGATIGYPTGPVASRDDDGSSPEHALFRTGEFLIQRGDRIAILGANGSGKTTFLKTILGEIPPLDGSIRIGASVRIGYLPQDQGWLNPETRALDHILDVGGFTIQEARDLLGRFLLSGDDVYKPIGALSGGELARVALATLAIRQANVLVLDEPTTHLDVASQELLQEALTTFNGTILLVSHDRYLIDALATQVYWIDGGRLHTVEGNYSTYVAARAASRKSSRTLTAPHTVSAQREAYRTARLAERKDRRQRAQVQALEEEIEGTECRLSAVTRSIEMAGIAQDVARVESLGREYETLSRALAHKLYEWERLADGDGARN